jgi:hypothetical protein
MEFIIKLKDIADISILMPLFTRLGITFIEKSDSKPSQKSQLPIVFAKNPDFMALTGIWKDKNITQDQLRKNTWGDRL